MAEMAIFLRLSLLFMPGSRYWLGTRYVHSRVGMGTYSDPEEIRAMKPKGTIVQKIKNQYYVYTHSQSKDRRQQMEDGNQGS
jgi:hypothetical protein